VLVRRIKTVRKRAGAERESKRAGENQNVLECSGAGASGQSENVPERTGAERSGESENELGAERNSESENVSKWSWESENMLKRSRES
jgi:hypothetical protein